MNHRFLRELKYFLKFQARQKNKIHENKNIYFLCFSKTTRKIIFFFHKLLC